MGEKRITGKRSQGEKRNWAWHRKRHARHLQHKV